MLCGVVVVVVGIVLRWEVITTFTTIVDAFWRGTGRAIRDDVFDEAAATFFNDFFSAIFVADGHRL